MSLTQLRPPTPSHMSRAKQNMMNALLAGETASMCAKRFHCHIETVMNVINSAAFKIKRAEIEQRALDMRSQSIATQVQGTFEDASPDAAQTIVHIAGSSLDPKTRLDAAKEVLDRAGFVVVKKSIEKHVVLNVPEEVLAAVVKAAENANEVTEGQREIRQYVEGSKNGRKDELREAVVVETTVSE